jgi:hypothetical protein
VVIELTGHHYHNNNPADSGGVYVQQSLIKNLETGFIDLPGKDGKTLEKVAIKDLGVMHPVLVYSSDIKDVPNPAYEPGDPQSQPPRLRRFDFIVQFWLTETPRSAREKVKQEAQAKPAEETTDTTETAAG